MVASGGQDVSPKAGEEKPVYLRVPLHRHLMRVIPTARPGQAVLMDRAQHPQDKWVMPIIDLSDGRSKILEVPRYAATQIDNIVRSFRARVKSRNWFHRLLQLLRLAPVRYCTDMAEARATLVIERRRNRQRLPVITVRYGGLDGTRSDLVETLPVDDV